MKIRIVHDDSSYSESFFEDSANPILHHEINVIGSFVKIDISGEVSKSVFIPEHRIIVIEVE